LSQRKLDLYPTTQIPTDLISVLATVITLPIKAALGRRSAAEVFTEFMDMGAGWPVGMVSLFLSLMERD
jgi:hypothetical protein